LVTLLDALRRRWWLISLVAASVFLGAALYVESLSSEYEGVTVTSFSPRPRISTENVRLLLPKYVAYITAPATLLELAPALGENAGELATSLDATITDETGNLTITVRLPTPERAATAANVLAEDVVAHSQQDDLIQGEVVAEAVPPESPSGPPRRLLQANALAVGLILGVALAFILERIRPRVRSAEEMAEISGYPIMGSLPSSRALRNPREAYSDPLVGPAFRTLRTNLQRDWKDQDIEVIAVTSPQDGDGKTAVATLYAESLAHLGVEVLLVDADLRRPGVSLALGMSAECGLSEILRGTANLRDGVQDGWTSGLSVITTKPDPIAGDLLARRFSEVMGQARAKFDIVIVDTPPLLDSDEGRTLVAHSSGVLLVVPISAMAQPLNEAVSALETLKVPVLGIVANRIGRSGKRFYGSQPRSSTAE